VNPDVPESLSALCERLLSKDPADRPASADEVSAALLAIQNGESNHIATAEYAREQSPGTDRRTRRRRVLTLSITLALSCGCMSPAAWLASELGFFGVPCAARQDVGAEHPGESRPLTVQSIEVKHFVPGPAGDESKGTLGHTSTTARLGDKVQVFAKLSKPAYAYLLAFRPDGKVELCDPDDEGVPTTKTDTPRYPPATTPLKSYGLREGTGLWVFAVVASETPLPAYRDWIAAHKPPWQPQPTPAGTVWWYDGNVLETLPEGSTPPRAKGEDLTGPAAAVVSLGKWSEQSNGTSGVIGFGVGP
jgi:hypothetical protein